MQKLPISRPFDSKTAFRLQAIMAWPNDVHMQEELLRQTYKDMEGFIDDCFPDKNDSLYIVNFFKEWREPLGGRFALAEMKGKTEIWADLKKRTFHGHICGMILTIAYRLYYFNKRPDLITWNKISHLIIVGSKAKMLGWGTPIYKTTIVEAWKASEKVAHLWSAKQYLNLLKENAPTIGKDGIEGYLNYFFAYSNTFQGFGINFKAKRSSKSFLNIDGLLMVEEKWAGEVEPEKLPELWIQILESYFAPVDGCPESVQPSTLIESKNRTRQ